MASTILEMRGITKTFPGVKALSNVNLSVEEGEIHAIVGENGAGKSTLMKVLSGVYPTGTYDGTIVYRGQECQFAGIHDSERLGIVIIHQELALVPMLSIAENIFLGNEHARHGIIDWNANETRTRELLKQVGLNEDPRTLITNIGVGKQQLVEIAKALSKEVKLLILDEPTASLSEKDSQALLDLLLEFKRQGLTSILISHKLNEVHRVADHVTIIRDGQTIETLGKGEISEDRIITSMVGRPLEDRFPPREPRIGDVVFEVKDWSVYHPIHAERQVIKGISMNVRRGEVEQSDLMLADLLITDAEAIRRVQSDSFDALDQVSNGYDADYEQIAPGRARQATIVGNHVALVKNARCGPVCSIGDSQPSLLKGAKSMANKKGSALLERMRKAFMTRDADAFEQVANEMTGDEGTEGGGQPAIHIHMPGQAPGGAAATADTDPPAGGEGNAAEQKIMTAIEGLTQAVNAIADRVTKLESGGTTTDADPDPNADPDPTLDSDPDPQGNSTKTGDSAGLAAQFQETLSQAEIIAPGIALPTFDAKAVRKKTVDALCVLRRRALRKGLEGDDADTIESVLSGTDLSKMTCDAVAPVFNAAVAAVKVKRAAVATRTNDSRQDQPRKDINQVHAEFWKKNRK